MDNYSFLYKNLLLYVIFYFATIVRFYVYVSSSIFFFFASNDLGSTARHSIQWTYLCVDANNTCIFLSNCILNMNNIDFLFHQVLCEFD